MGVGITISANQYQSPSASVPVWLSTSQYPSKIQRIHWIISYGTVCLPPVHPIYYLTLLCESAWPSVSVGIGLHQHIPISQQHSKDSLDHIIWDSVSTYSASYILSNPAMWISVAISISRHWCQCQSASAQSNIPARFNEFIESYHTVQCVCLQYTLYIIHQFTEFGEPIWYDTLFCSLNCIIWHTVTSLPANTPSHEHQVNNRNSPKSSTQAPQKYCSLLYFVLSTAHIIVCKYMTSQNICQFWLYTWWKSILNCHHWGKSFHSLYCWG